VREEAGKEEWKYHIVPVVNYAKKLAKLLKVDEEITEIAALLHDIGRLKFGSRNHHITGMFEAEKILRNYKYPQKIIDEVKHCIKSHRGSKNIKPKTTIAKIIANADAMAHFDVLPILFYSHYKKGSFEEVFKQIEEKIEREWNKKITLPEAKKMLQEKYKAIKLILNSNKRYIE